MVITVFLLDKNFSMLGVLNNKISWSYNKAINKATNIQVSIPREDFDGNSKSNLVNLSQYLQIYADGVYVIGGRITKRDFSDTIVDITAFTEEIKMESVICPAQYTRKYDGWDLGDIVRDLGKGWNTKRIKSTSQWLTKVNSSNIDFNTLSDKIILKKDASGVYKQNGYVTYRFLASDTEGFDSWDRIRWVADNFSQTDDGVVELVSTTIQYRYGTSSSSMGNWSSPITGAMPDTLGLDISILDSPILEVKINLHTDDLTSEDNAGNPVGSSPVVFALEVISRTEPYIGTINIPSITGKVVNGLIADEDSAFSLLKSACEIADWEFEVYNNDIYLSDRLGNDLTESFVFKKDENVRITQVGDSDEVLVNIIHANGKGDGINKITTTLRDENSIALYGEYPAVESFDTEDPAELELLAQDYLDRYSIPEFDWRVDTFDSTDSTITNNVSVETGLTFHRLYSNSVFTVPSHNIMEQNLFFYNPQYMVGDIIRIVDPYRGTILDSRILEEKRSGDSDGVRVTLYLNKPKETLVSRVPKPIEEGPLSAPTAISVKPTVGGVSVAVPAPNERYRWAETEIFVSETSPVDTTNPVKVSRSTSFNLGALDSFKRYYFTARYIDNNRKPSAISKEISCIPDELDLSLVSEIISFGIKPNYPTDGKIRLCGTKLTGELVEEDGLILSPTNNSHFSIPNVTVDCSDDAFKTVGVTQNSWTYLLYNTGTITPIYYSIADAMFYKSNGTSVSSGLVIGKVKVGVSPFDGESAYITETESFKLATTLGSVTNEQTQMAFKYLSTASTPAEFEEFADNLGITDFFTTLAVWELFAEKIKVNQLQVGSGNKDSGFVFYAIDDRESGESTIQAWSDGVKIFEINPETKNVTIGDYEKENGIRWVDKSGELVFKGTGKFTGDIDHESLKTREEDSSGATVNTPAKTRYIGKDLYNTLSSVSTSGFTSVSGTYDSKNINSISRMPNTNSLRQIAYKSSSGNISITCPMTCRVKITYNCISTLLNNTTTNLYVNGSKISSVYCSNWGDTKTVTVYKDVIKGQIISTSNSGQNKAQYVKVEAYGDGTIIKISNSEMYLLKKEGFFSKPLNITSPNTFNYNSFKKYASGQDFINNASSLALDKTYSTSLPNSSFSVNGGSPKTVSSVLRMATEMRLYFTDGKLQTITKDNAEGATTGWYNMNGSFKLLTATSAILTKNIEPQENAQYDLGYKGASPGNDKRINNIYLSTSIQGDETSEIKGFNQFDMLTGMVAPFATNTTPIGWLKCDGTAYLRDSYSTLFSRIGTTYGSTNGSNFRVPDLRGEFIRGLDNGRGVDSGRSLGSNQSDSLKSHKHKYYEPSSLGSSASGIGGASGFTTNKTDTWATGDSETRPRNVALVYYIKY